MPFIKKIVILGPESTGKSTLCRQLATRYQTSWVPEYARTYLHEHGMQYTYDDLLTIARGQLLLEDKYIEELKLISANLPAKSIVPLFIDTNMYVMKIWCEFVFNRCHDWILKQIVARQYDHYFLCDADLPWIKDDLREYPDIESRQKLFHMYKDLMINQPVPWTEIGGDYEQRLQIAISAVDDLLAAN